MIHHRKHMGTIKRSALLIVLLFACVHIVTISSNSAKAAIMDSFDAEYIISDSNFVAKNSMSVSQIQSFLNSKNSVCLKNFTALGLYDQNKDGLGDEPYGKGSNVKVSAATLIWQAAQLYNVSPKVILVTLEKEQGLISRTDCPQWRYNTALGYGCPDTAPCDESAYGLTRQIDYGVWHFRGFFEDSYPVPTKVPGRQYIGYNPSSSCGGKTITIRNRATAALYTYTPYQPNQAARDAPIGTSVTCGAYGNKNFFYFYTKWFGIPNSNADSLLVNCSDGNYLIESNGMRRKFTSNGMLAWGLSQSDFLNIDYGCSFPAYTLPQDNIVRSRSTGKLYLADSSNAYHINSQTTATAWKIGAISDRSAFPMEDSSFILSHLSTGKILPRMATSSNPERSDVYLISAGKRHLINGTQAANNSSLNLYGDSSDVATVSVGALLTLASSDTIDYSFKVGPTLYLLNRTGLLIPSNSSLATWESIISESPSVSSDILSLFPKRSSVDLSFRYTNTYYNILSSTSHDTTSSARIAESWNSPSYRVEISTDLRNKALASSNLRLNLKELPGNVRLISCNNQHYIIERFIRTKRAISAQQATHWGFDDYHYITGDKGCAYSTYTTSLDEDLIRSRNTGKVYYVQNEKAYYVRDQAEADARSLGDISDVYPMFDPASIHDNLTVNSRLP